MTNPEIKNLDRMGFITVVTVLTLCAGLVAGYGVKKKSRIRKDAALVTERLNRLKLAERNLRHLTAVLDDTEKQLDTVYRQIPESSEIGDFFKHLDRLAKTRKAELISVHPKAGVKENTLTKIPVQITVQGVFVDLYRLIRDIETLDRKVVIDTMKISKHDKTAVCRADLVLNLLKR